MIIGSHVHFGSDGLLGSVKEAISYNGTTFMFYTGAPQNTVRKPIDKENTAKALKLMEENHMDINNVVCHAPYIINLANNSNIDSWDFSISFLRNELKRCEELGVKYIVVHPGNSLTLDREVALKNIANALNQIIDSNTKVMVLLETMAGKGTECGINLDELKYIIDNVIYQKMLGVCLDTCHLNDSGVDINDFDNYLKRFDQIIGLSKVKCVHINDSLNPIGSHKDRHANIGYGTIGFDTLNSVVHHELLKDVPKILETPYIDDMPPYKVEIEMFNNNSFNPNLKEELIKLYKNL